MTLNSGTAHTQTSPLDYYGFAADQCTMSHGTYIHIINYAIEMYIWNQTGKSNILQTTHQQEISCDVLIYNVPL